MRRSSSGFEGGVAPGDRVFRGIIPERGPALRETGDELAVPGVRGAEKFQGKIGRILRPGGEGREALRQPVRGSKGVEILQELPQQRRLLAGEGRQQLELLLRAERQEGKPAKLQIVREGLEEFPGGIEFLRERREEADAGI